MYCVIDTSAKTLRYSNAGHCFPLLQRSRGDVRVLTDGGIVLGIFPDAKYLDGAMHLEPGNKLLLFTDGIMEATNTRGQEYGEDDCDGNLMTIQAERLRRCITN